MSFCFPRSADFHGEYRSGKPGLPEAIDPSCESCNGTFRHMLFILSRTAQHINITEPIIGRIERIGPVEQGFELATHLIVVDGRCKGDYVGITVKLKGRFLVICLFKDCRTVLVRHLTGIGGKQPAHRFAGITGQGVTLPAGETVIAHLQVIYLAGPLQCSECC